MLLVKCVVQLVVPWVLVQANHLNLFCVMRHNNALFNKI